MSRNSVIKAGLPWNFTGSPNSKAMIQNLERNESLITWLQPNDGKITDQFPAICINEQYYTLSLRQMKAGLQMCAFYFYKQAHSQMDSVAPHPPQEELCQPRGRAARRDQARIPEVLLVEKLRTQQRFNVSVPVVHSASVYPRHSPAGPGHARNSLRTKPQDHRAQAHRRDPLPAHPRGRAPARRHHLLYRPGGRVPPLHRRPAAPRLSAVVPG